MGRQESKPICIFIYFLNFLKDFIYLLILRGREGERKGKKHQYVIANCMPLHGDLARNPGMCPDHVPCDPLVLRLALNPLSHTSQGPICIFKSSLWQLHGKLALGSTYGLNFVLLIRKKKKRNVAILTPVYQNVSLFGNGAIADVIS